ncbi:MAG: Gfo/Idh/MocA family protein [Phycisphaerales bacterium JB038]
MTNARPTNVGIVGCGAISGIYCRNLSGFESTQLVACADIEEARARELAHRFGIPRALTTDALLRDPEVDIVLNLTIPAAHAEVALGAVRAGKHVYNEKPLTIDLREAEQLLAEAEDGGVRVGAAPDTFLGAGLQTCRQLVDEGALGEVVGGSAFMVCPGHESWHPDPAFYYQRGGGPLFDMGPYYLTALVMLLGPVLRVTGSTRRSFATRMISSEPRRGDRIAVEVPTHISALLDFASGPVVNLTMSFDVQAARLPMLELYGSRTSLSLPDPNTFHGPVELFSHEAKAWEAIDLVDGFAEDSRGLGLAEMTAGLRQQRPHAAGGEMALHVLEIMHAVHEASSTEQHVRLRTTCERPRLLDPAWRP